MAKVSMINREKKRAKLVKKYAKKRAELKAVIVDPEVLRGAPGGDVRLAEAASRFQPGAAAKSRQVWTGSKRRAHDILPLMRRSQNSDTKLAPISRSATCAKGSSG